MALGDAGRLLSQSIGRQLVGRRVLPLARAVGRLAVLLRGDDLVLAAAAEAGQAELIDLTALGRGTGLPRATLEGAHDAAFDDAFEAVHAERLGAQDRHPLVAPRPRRADQLVVRGTQALAVQVVHGAEAVEDHAAGGDAALNRNWQHLMNAASELGVDDHLGQNAAYGLVQLEGGARELLAGGDGYREGVDVQLGGGRRDQADLHGWK